MTLAAGRVEDGLIRQVQKRWAKDRWRPQLAAALLRPQRLGGHACDARSGSRAMRVPPSSSSPEKPRKKHKLRMRPLARRAGPAEGTAVEILNDDMPFLVDS